MQRVIQSRLETEMYATTPGDQSELKYLPLFRQLIQHLGDGNGKLYHPGIEWKGDMFGTALTPAQQAAGGGGDEDDDYGGEEGE